MNQATIDFKKAWDAEAVAMIETLTTERDELRAKLEGGVRVGVFRNLLGKLTAVENAGATSNGGTLILDDGAEI